MAKTKASAAAPARQWFLLRGLAREAGHWGSFVEALKTRISGSEVVTLDLPGTGEFIDLAAPTSIEENAEFVREQFQKRRNPKASAYVFALSLGGMVATEWLRQDSDGVDGLILVNTSFRGYSPIYYRLWIQALPHLWAALNEEDPVRRERHVLSMISNRPENYDRLAQQWAQIYNERPISKLTFARQLLAAGRYTPPKTPPPVRTLLLNSLHDRMVHARCSEMISEVWRCELRRHPTAGHDLVIDAETWVLQVLEDWLSEEDHHRRKVGAHV